MRTIWTLYENDYTILLSGIAGFALLWLLAIILYKTGQWGGGDSKILMALGALLGVTISQDTLFQQPLIAFLTNLIFIAALYGIIYATYLALTHYKQYTITYHEIWHAHKKRTIALTVISLAIFIAGLFTHYALLTTLIAIILLALHTFYLVLSAVETSCLIKRVPITSLTGGEWLAQEVHHHGKKILAPIGREISTEDITLLHKKKITHIIIKEGMPMIPAFLLTYISVLLLGNLFPYFFTLF